MTSCFNFFVYFSVSSIFRRCTPLPTYFDYGCGSNQSCCWRYRACGPLQHRCGLLRVRLARPQLWHHLPNQLAQAGHCEAATQALECSCRPQRRPRGRSIPARSGCHREDISKAESQILDFFFCRGRENLCEVGTDVPRRVSPLATYCKRTMTLCGRL